MWKNWCTILDSICKISYVIRNVLSWKIIIIIELYITDLTAVIRLWFLYSIFLWKSFKLFHPSNSLILIRAWLVSTWYHYAFFKDWEYIKLLTWTEYSVTMKLKKNRWLVTWQDEVLNSFIAVLCCKVTNYVQQLHELSCAVK